MSATIAVDGVLGDGVLGYMGNAGVDEVACWLVDSAHLPQYEQTFRDNEVDGDMLLDLVARDLLGELVESRVHQSRLRSQLAKCVRLASAGGAVDAFTTDPGASVAAASARRASRRSCGPVPTSRAARSSFRQPRRTPARPEGEHAGEGASARALGTRRAADALLSDGERPRQRARHGDSLWRVHPSAAVQSMPRHACAIVSERGTAATAAAVALATPPAPLVAAESPARGMLVYARPPLADLEVRPVAWSNSRALHHRSSLSFPPSPRTSVCATYRVQSFIPS